ncbi:MAG: ABC transporter ATP-binding protein, partial [Coprobacillus sp.]
MIEFKDISKKYGDTTVIENFNMKIESGELVTLIGLSGCGKTTTLKMINRIIKPSSGDIIIDGKSTNDYNPIKLRREIGYVIQQTGLFPHMSVGQNIAIIPEAEKVDEATIIERTKSLMAMVNLDYDTYVDSYPDELSGGQQQRVGIARAFANEANIILMDEPFSALDPITRTQLQDELIKIQKKTNKTIVFVTHDMSEAIKISDRICIMNEGRIEQFDTPENILREPATEFVSEFLGGSKLWDSPDLLKAYDIINPNPVTITIDRKLVKAVDKFKESKVEYLMVLDDDDHFLGYVSALDIRRGKSGDSLEDYLRNDMYTCNIDTPVLDLFEKIQEDYISIIPV